MLLHSKVYRAVLGQVCMKEVFSLLPSKRRFSREREAQGRPPEGNRARALLGDRGIGNGACVSVMPLCSLCARELFIKGSGDLGSFIAAMFVSSMVGRYHI